ncbi:MAG: flagellar export chaperone FliS [Gammaproteobacteria bacterium]|nr:flagellar export chaperone FliS [Gammaproteobacteria bacterium]MDH5652949.1 flagellar export chaperone FliS [Gammaproteobacteria bacterium]
MSTAKLNDAVKEYNKVSVASSVEAADPHRLIQMLMQGAMEKVAIAKGYMERSDVANKGAHISWAISIIEGLRTSLNKDAGGELAQNLDDLYDYMIRRLLRANIENNIDILDEVSSLMVTIKGAWDELPQQLGKSGDVAIQTQSVDIQEG